ncbi:uncharacterized protein LOC125051749 [Pieris napi]|uniref:uncharacterized protein LOC125051749 n=1 Tax=Pieris napi TaxID=78633 RepID=UPI001FBBA6D2|nr:uncharacterized protein LOC125051749 [Pieris napi]XP_047508244.1 uncharacterized protein LOC125051749 [Pieris napi]
MGKKKCYKRKKTTSAVYKQDVDNKQDEVKSDISVSKITLDPSNSVSQPVLIKLCRLCETKDGPFVEMFDAETMLAKKIDDIMPFVIAENDDLPQKICFRCSAKVEEVYEFIQKCLKTQEKFQEAAGIKVVLKQKQYSYRSAWEDKLNERNISNDDVCNALILKAIEGIRNLPITPSGESEKKIIKKETRSSFKSLKEDNIDDYKNKEDSKEINKPIEIQRNTNKAQSDHSAPKIAETPKVTDKQVMKINTFCTDRDDSTEISEEVKPFNIMDHVSMIKVNGVGVLFQCKLCNRNFLVKEVVMNHRCAKNGGKKIAEEDKTVAPPPPKVPLIKYINTKPQTENITSGTKSNECSSKIINSTPINVDDDEDDTPLLPQKPKRKIGPASKMRQLENIQSTTSSANQSLQQTSQIPSSETLVAAPTVQMPNSVLHPNSRFKLVPGPNNSFMLVEDKLEDTPVSESVTNKSTTIEKMNNLQTLTVKSGPKSKRTTIKTNVNQQQSCPTEQPYPVRLIKSGVACHSDSLSPSETTPGKKQSYTIVQTGNPSKLLISTKSHPADEVPTKRLKQTVRENSFSGPSENTQKCFTFVNVDSTTQPSYVLPTGNIVQESQISTSMIKPGDEIDKYPCDICGEKFSREKKLQSHIQSHYNQLDEEDQKRGSTKKRKLMT